MAERWQEVFRRGLAPLLSTRALTALQVALASDDRRLIQGNTIEPTAAELGPVRAACPISWCGWQGEAIQAYSGVCEFFAKTCNDINRRLGDSGACAPFLNFVDETPRMEMLAALLPEVDAALAERRLAGEELAAVGIADGARCARLMV